MRFPAFMLVPVFTLGLTGTHAVGLPDTGQTFCDNGSHVPNVFEACSSANTGDAATYPRQDGRFGRDAAAAAGTLVKTGAGAAGFDYTKVANSGADLAPGAALGSNSADWACTRDNVTGLTWEVKTATPSDLRYFGKPFTWYSSNISTNAGNAGYSQIPCYVKQTNLCDTQSFITAVNAAALCSYSDWRLPTLRELVTLVHYGLQNPSIDTSYFPNTLIPYTSASAYWSASSSASDSTSAWLVSFSNGGNNVQGKDNFLAVRLVRGGLF